MQEGFGKEPSALKVKSSKRGGGGGGEIVEVQGGGRILRSIGRKDRHSKVCTARGPRDRRLRLSANIAIQFYDVQDRLGYDRPSEAIDWLMKEAKSAIDALAEKKKPDDKAQQLEQHQQEEQNQCEFSNEEPINSLSFLIPSSSSTEFESLANWSNPQTIGFGNYQRKIGGYVTDTMPQWQQQQQQQQKVVLGQQDQLFSQGGTLQSSCFSPSFLALMNPQISGLNYDQMPEISSSLAGAGGDSFSGDGLSGFCVPPRVRGGEDERHNPVPNKPSSASCLLHYHGL